MPPRLHLDLPGVQAGLRAAGPGAGDPLLLLDLDAIAGRVAALRAAFPPGTAIAAAVKALPVGAALRAAHAAGAGLELGTATEWALAERLGVPGPARVVDGADLGPDALERALAAGARVTLDRLDLLPVAAARRAAGLRTGGISLRLHPGTGQGGALDTGAPGAWFGVAADDPALGAALRRFPGLVDGLAVHAGSNPASLAPVAAAAAALHAAREGLRAAGLGPFPVVDFGGGMPLLAGAAAPGPADWVAALRAAAPCVDEPGVQIIVEPGRWLFGPVGALVATVVAVRAAAAPGARPTVRTTAGADLLPAAAMTGGRSAHRPALLRPDLGAAPGPAAPTDLVGALCWAGDRLARAVPLPAAAPGDRVVFFDAGAYTVGMGLRLGQRPRPAIWARRGGAWACVLPAESAADLAAAWDPRGAWEMTD